MTQTVSIVMLTCNNMAKVQRCLPTWLPLLRDHIVEEWLILDNGSVDGTRMWLEHFSRKHPKIKVSGARDNLGCAGGRAELFQRAKGDLILSMDSDVRRVSRKAIRTLAELLDNPRIGIVGDRGGGVRADWTWTSEASTRYVGEIPLVCGYCQMFRRSALDHVALDMFYNPYWLEDSDFCLQFRDKLGQVGFVQPCGIQHVWSGTNSGGRPEQETRWEYFCAKWRKRFGDTIVYTPPPRRIPASPWLSKYRDRPPSRRPRSQ